MMFSVEGASSFFAELEHFKVGYGKLFFGGCDHFSEVEIGVGFEHAVSSM